MPASSHRLTRALAALAALPLLVSLAACGNDGSARAADLRPGSGSPATTLRLGYFGNVTHAPALVAVGKGFLAEDLGRTRLETQVFNAGPAAIEALDAGAIDAAYIGPNPAVNAFARSNGAAVRIISGVTSGGAQLVVRPGIRSADDLKGTNLASPQLGGTQDVALRTWLTRHGLKSPLSGGGDVTITPTENAQTLRLFQAGKLDGAWLPEPWASRLVLEAGARVLVDERSLWPHGRFPTTVLIVSKRFLEKHPQTVEALLRANLDAIDWITGHQAEARRVVNDQVAKASGKPLSDPVLARAFAGIAVTTDPLASTLPALLSDGVDAGVTRRASLTGIYDLRLLNRVLEEKGRPPVSAAGLGED